MVILFGDESSNTVFLYSHLPILLTPFCLLETVLAHCVALAGLEFSRVLGLNTHVTTQPVLLTLNFEIVSGFQMRCF